MMLDLKELSGYIYNKPEKISIGVAGVITKDNKVLLVQNSISDTWSFPGGHLHQNESLQDGVKREVFEETGKNFIIESEPTFYNFRLNNKLFLFIFFYKGKLKNDDGKYRPSNDEVKIVEWFDINSLPENRYENVDTIFRHFATKR